MSSRKRPPLSKSRKALLAAYKASYNEINEIIKCAACGIPLCKVEGERHHPAGRRKAAFCFTVILHHQCHKQVHNDPSWATDNGLLWPGRNSKVLTLNDAKELVLKQPFPALYSIPILETFSLTKI